MATYRKTYSNGSTPSGKNTYCVEFTNNSRSKSEISPNIPNYSTLNNVIISFQWCTDKSFSSGDLQVYVNKSADDWLSWDDGANQIGSTSQAKNNFVSVYFDKNSPITDLSTRLPDFFNSGKKNVGEYSGSYSVCAWFNAFVMRNFYWQNMYMEFDYTPPTFTISAKSDGGGTVSGGGTFNVTVANQTKTITATPNTNYKFVKWVDSKGNTYNTQSINVTISESNISAHSTTVTYTAYFEKIVYTATFKNHDGSVVSTKTLNVGEMLGTLPTVSRNGYEFAGWLPCKPAKDLYGNVLDSRYYGGLTSYPLAQDYKYKDKFALHIEAHKTDWSDIKPRDNKPGEQIISCTEGGGWGLGYQAGNDTSGRGTEIYSSSGYKIIDFGYENFKDNDWYTFDLIFNNGTFEAYVNGEKKGSVSTGSSTISYNSTNTIFVGAEAGGNTETPTGNYFNGTISNVFIANQGERLAQPTPELVIYNPMDFYPIWRKLPTYKAEFLNYDKSLLHTSIQSQGSTPTYTGPTPTKPSDDDYEYEFSGWEPKLGPITNDTSYIAQFKGIKNKYNLFVSTQGGGKSDKEGVTQGIDYGTEITITAIPDVGHRFVEWGDGNSENPRTFKLKGDTFLYPIFEKDFFSVELIGGQVDLVVSGQEKEGKYEYYSDLKISPIEKPGYKFTHWTGEVEEFQGEYFIRVLSDIKIVANYQELKMVFKSVKIYYPTENDLVSPDKPVEGGDRVYLEVQVALE